jgi:hypothetical protein
MTLKRLLAAIAVLTLVMVIPALAAAAPVGRFTKVEGQVDLLKQGKLPAVPAKVQDAVDSGDVVRTKSKSKAQIKFVDDSVITLAPESRMAVADYVYEPDKSYRRAVIRLFRGLAHTVVTKLLNVEEPGFVTETHTAILGVRGTESYTLLMPNFTSEYLVHGLKDVRSINPQFPAVLKLKGGEFTMIALNQQWQLPKPITPAMLQMLQNMMVTGIGSHVLLGGGGHLGGTGGGLPEFKLPVSPDQMTQPIIPPAVPPPTQTPVAPPGPSGGT